MAAASDQIIEGLLERRLKSIEEEVSAWPFQSLPPSFSAGLSKRFREIADGIDARRAAGDAAGTGGSSSPGGYGGSPTRRAINQSVNLIEGLKKSFDSSEGDRGDASPADAAAVQQAISDMSSDPDAPNNLSGLNKEQFKLFLQHFQVPVEEFGVGKAKALSDLWVEMAMAESKFVLRDAASLLRSAAVIIVELHATAEGRDVFLLLKQHETAGGATRRDLNTRVTKKRLVDEDGDSAVWRCLVQNLDLEEKVCKDSFEIESSRTVEETKDSLGYPGLLTHYTLYVTRVRMKSNCLPTSPEFESSVRGGAMGGSSKKVWRWCPRDEYERLFPPA